MNRPDLLQLPETGDAPMAAVDQLPIALAVFFAVLGLGLVVGVYVGWAFAVGLAFRPVLGWVVGWMERDGG